MRQALACLAGLVLLFAGGTSSAADEDAAGPVRAAFEALVEHVRSRTRRPTGPSLTAKVRTLLAHDAVAVERVEAVAWARVRGQAASFAVEEVIRFLHDRPSRKDPGLVAFGERRGFDLIGGAVVYRRGLGGSRSGPLLEPFDGTFGSLAGGRPLRAAPVPRAAELVAVEPPPRGVGPLAPGWCDAVHWDVGMALGEACASDDAAFAALRERCAAERPTPLALIALGWSRRPEAVTRLAEVVTALSWTDEELEFGYGLTSIGAALAALEHADPAARERVVRAFTDEQSCVVFGRPTPSQVTLRRLDAASAAKDAEGRRQAVLRLAATRVVTVPTGAGAARYLRFLIDAARSEDPAVRDAVGPLIDRAAHVVRPGTVSESRYRGPEGDEARLDAALGSPGEALARLRQIAEDVEAGRAAYVERIVDGSARARTTASFGGRARSDVGAGDPLGRASRDVPVRVAVTFGERGIVVRLTNDGAGPVCVEPVGLRYGQAVRSVVETRPDGGTKTSETRHGLTIGAFESRLTVPSWTVRRLDPRGWIDVELAFPPDVLDELRAAEHLDIRLVSLPVVGDPGAPVVQFGWTPVR